MGVAAEPLVIVGAGGFGREVLNVVDAVNRYENRWRFLGFIDDGEPDVELLEARGAQHLGTLDELAELDAAYVIGIGNPVARRAVAERCDSYGLSAADLVHPCCELGRDVTFGAGLIATVNTVVTTNVVMGRHVHLNLNSTVGHDCRLGDYVTINPGANISGSVTLGDSVTIGTGASVIQGKSIGHGSTIGAGAAVVTDIAPNSIAVGVPARAH